MFESIEWSGTGLAMTMVFWLIVLAATWKFNIGEGFSIPYKIIVSIVSLPVIFITVQWQISR